MEFLFEFILELVFEGSLELVQSNRVPKIIRWILVIISILFFGGIIFGMMYLGILIMKKSFFVSLFVLFVSGFMLVGCVLKGIEVYKRIHSNN